MKKRHYLFLAALLMGFSLQAQVVSEQFWRPDFGILTTESDTVNNVLYAGGNFTKFLPPTEPNGTKVDLITGEPNYAFANPNSNVFCSVSDGNGGYFIGGNFTQVGDSMRKALAHIDASGNVTAWNPDMVGSASSYVRAIARSGDSIFIGGNFGQIGGQTRYCFAAVSASTGSLYNWAPAFSGTIYSLVAKNNALYVGGTFTYVESGSNVYNHLVRFDLTSGNPSNWKPEIVGFVNGIEVVDTTVYIIGPIFTVNGEDRLDFASIHEIRDAFGTIIGDSLSDLVITTNGTSNGSILDLQAIGDSLFVSGQFDTLNSQARTGIALINRHNGQVLPFSLDVNGDIGPMSLKDSILYFGGGFGQVNGIRREGLAAYNLNTSSLTNWNPGIVSGGAANIDISGTSAYVSGYFYTIGLKYRGHIAAYNPSTGIPTSWAPEFNDRVNTIHIKGDKIFVGGKFTEVDGNTRNHLAVFNRATGALLSWAPSVNGSVYDITSNDSTLFIGGGFSQVDGASRGNMAALGLSSQTLLSWNPALNDSVKQIYVNGAYVYAGGNFTASAGTTRNHIARFNAGSLALDSWNPDVDGEVRAIAENGNQVLVGGNFTTVNSTSRNGFASIQNAANTLNSLDVNPNGAVQAIVSYGTKAYLGGEFYNIGGQQRWFTAELDLAAGSITPWNISPTGPYGTTASLCVYDSMLIISGSTDEQASGHIFGIPDFANFTPAPFSVNVFTHPSFYNTCSGSALVQITGAPGYTVTVDNANTYTSNGNITVDSLCAGIHSLVAQDFYSNTITQYFIIAQDSGTFILDTLSTGGYNLFGLTIENCDIDYATIDTVYIISSTISGNQATFVWIVEDSLGSHTDSATYDLYLGPGMYYVQIGFYCPFKDQSDYYSYTQLVNITEGASVAGVTDLSGESRFVSVYPNPTTGQVRINFSGSDAELTVYDLQGKQVLKDQIQDQQLISLEHFERGVYFFDFRNSQGHSVQRVVKQ